jgi:hypothetical protein
VRRDRRPRPCWHRPSDVHDGCTGPGGRRSHRWYSDMDVLDPRSLASTVRLDGSAEATNMAQGVTDLKQARPAPYRPWSLRLLARRMTLHNVCQSLAARARFCGPEGPAIQSESYTGRSIRPCRLPYTVTRDPGVTIAGFWSLTLSGPSVIDHRRPYHRESRALCMVPRRRVVGLPPSIFVCFLRQVCAPSRRGTNSGGFHLIFLRRYRAGTSRPHIPYA